MLLSVWNIFQGTSHLEQATIPKEAPACVTSAVQWFWKPSCVTTSSSNVSMIGRAIAQAVSRRLATAAAQVWAQVRLCGICGGQSGTEAGFVGVLRFPLPIFIPPTAPHSSCIIRGWYSRPVSGRRIKWTQSHPTPPQGIKRKLQWWPYTLHQYINKEEVVMILWTQYSDAFILT
jgi:hypothetical protein